MTTKNDVKIEEYRASTTRFRYVCGIIKHFITIGGVLGALYIIFEGLKPFLKSDPQVLMVMVQILDKLNIYNITGYIVAAGASTGWALERKGKKRAIKEKGRYQALAESLDAYRSTSGLTSSGDTPREEEE